MPKSNESFKMNAFWCWTDRFMASDWIVFLHLSNTSNADKIVKQNVFTKRQNVFWYQWDGKCTTDSRKTLSVRPAEMFFDSRLYVDGNKNTKGKRRSRISGGWLFYCLKVQKVKQGHCDFCGDSISDAGLWLLRVKYICRPTAAAEETAEAMTIFQAAETVQVSETMER